MVEIFGIVYDNTTTEYKPYINQATEKLWRFENNPMLDIVDNHISHLSDEDYLGIVSWKFRDKTGLNKNKLMNLVARAPKVDVINCCRHHGKNIHFMDWSDEGHKGIKGFIQRCCAHVGMSYTNDPEYIIFANQFLAKKKIYVAYINDVIKPCLELLEGSMWEEVNRNAGYTRAMEATKLKQLTGLDFYNYVPFILERMMSQYIFNKNLSCIDINPK